MTMTVTMLVLPAMKAIYMMIRIRTAAVIPVLLLQMNLALILMMTIMAMKYHRRILIATAAAAVQMKSCVTALTMPLTPTLMKGSLTRILQFQLRQVLRVELQLPRCQHLALVCPEKRLLALQFLDLGSCAITRKRKILLLFATLTRQHTIAAVAAQ